MLGQRGLFPVLRGDGDGGGYNLSDALFDLGEKPCKLLLCRPGSKQVTRKGLLFHLDLGAGGCSDAPTPTGCGRKEPSPAVLEGSKNPSS